MKWYLIGKNYYKNVNDIDDSVEEIDKISKDNF